jgi:hypothetical protein
METIKRGPGRPKNESRAERVSRVPLGAPRLKLTVPDDSPDTVRRWLNDQESRLEDAEAGGYRFVERISNVGTPDVIPGNTDTGSRTSKIVGVKDDGSPLRAYLMEIDRETYEADQAAKADRIKEVEDTIRSGNIDGKASDGRYIPTEGIRMR